MEERPYENREIDMKFQNLSRQVEENHTDTTDRISELDRKNHDRHLEVSAFLLEIKTQTMKTNGRVNKLEAYRTGIVMCISVFVFIVIPLIVYIYINQTQEFTMQLSHLQR